MERCDRISEEAIGGFEGADFKSRGESGWGVLLVLVGRGKED
jgi:hypothetical protein